MTQWTQVRTLGTSVVVFLVVSALALTAPVSSAAAASNLDGSERTQMDSAVQRAHADAEIRDGQTYWVGQTLYADDFEADDSVQLRGGSPDDDRGLVTRVAVDGDGEVLVPTDSRASGQYYLTDGDGTTVEFSLVRQTLSANFENRTVMNQGSDTEVTLSIRSNRASSPLYLTMTSEGEALSGEHLRRIVGEGRAVDADADGNAEVLELTVGASASLTLDFSNRSGGNYSLVATVPDTTARTTANVSVTSAGPGTATFAKRVLVGTVGDVVVVPLSFTDATTAQLEVGSADLGYHLTMTVTDEDGDGEALVRWNTHLAGRSSATDVFSAASADSVSNVSYASGYAGQLSGPLDTEPYPLSVSVDSTENDVGVVSLREWTEHDLSILSANSTVGSADEARRVASESGRIGTDEWLVVRIDSPGIGGAVTDKQSLLSDDEGISLRIEGAPTAVTIEESPTGPNAVDGPPSVDLSSDDVHVVADSTRGLVWVVVKVDRVEALRAGTDYTATFAVDASRTDYLRNEGVEVSRSFTVAPRVCGRDVAPLVESYNDNAEQVPSFAKGMVSDERIHVVVDGDERRDYAAVTTRDRRLSTFRPGPPANPTLAVETDCETLTRVVDASNTTAAFVSEYEAGEITVRGVGIANVVAVEVVELGVRIGRTLGLL